MPGDRTFGNLKRELVRRRGSGAEEDSLLRSKSLVLLLVLVLGLLRDLVQVNGEGVALCEQARLTIGWGSTLCTLALRRRDFVARGLGLLLLLLLELAWRVAATILAEVDLELPVLVLASDSLDGLDGIGDVGEVDKCATLLPQSIDQLDLAVLGEVLSQPLLGPAFVQVADVHIS